MPWFSKQGFLNLWVYRNYHELGEEKSQPGASNKGVQLWGASTVKEGMGSHLHRWWLALLTCHRVRESGPAVVTRRNEREGGGGAIDWPPRLRPAAAGAPTPQPRVCWPRVVVAALMDAGVDALFLRAPDVDISPQPTLTRWPRRRAERRGDEWSKASWWGGEQRRWKACCAGRRGGGRAVHAQKVLAGEGTRNGWGSAESRHHRLAGDELHSASPTWR
jgi:hypothetical protein